MAKIVSINSEILAALREYKVNSEEAQLYLLGIYFNLNIIILAFMCTRIN